MLSFLTLKKYAFGNGVSVIEDQKTGRFCLINVLGVPIGCYRVFRPEHRFLLKLFDGISVHKLAKLSGRQINELKDIVGTLDRELYFQNIPSPSGFSKRFSPTPNAAGDQFETFLEEESRKYKKGGKPWSFYGHKDQIPSLHAYTHLTNLCNLSCAYCFTEANEKNDNSLRTPLHMPRETIEKTLASFCALIRHRYGTGKLNLVLFGGEPTLKGELRRTLYWTAERACEICRENREWLVSGLISSWPSTLRRNQKFSHNIVLGLYRSSARRQSKI